MATNGGLCPPSNIRVCLCLSSSTATNCWFMLCPGHYNLLIYALSWAFSEMSKDLAIGLRLFMAQWHCNKWTSLSTVNIRDCLCLTTPSNSKKKASIWYENIFYFSFTELQIVLLVMLSPGHFVKRPGPCNHAYAHTRQLVLPVLWIDGGPVWSVFVNGLHLLWR